MATAIIKCPRCTKGVEVVPAHAGVTYPCPNCNIPFILWFPEPALRTPVPENQETSNAWIYSFGCMAWIAAIWVVSLFVGWTAITSFVIGFAKIIIALIAGSSLLSLSFAIATDAFTKVAETTRSFGLAALVFLLWLGSLLVISYRVFFWLWKALW